MKVEINSINPETITLDKIIYVFLTQDALLYTFNDYDIFKTKFTISEFDKAIKNKEKIIYTTQLEAINSKYFEMGYDLVLIEDNKSIKFSDIIKDKNCALTFGREIRLAHNWRKMFRSGCFDIKYNWEK